MDRLGDIFTSWIEHSASILDPISSSVSEELHPYFPTEAVIANYSPNSYDVLTLLGVFSAIVTGLLGVVYLSLQTWAPRIRTGDRMCVLWFTLSGSLHVFFEGYFVLNHQRMGSNTDVFGQLWKEYALSDSRYMSSESMVLCLESITVVVWGPGCFLVAYLIASQHPLRFPLQALVSLGHVYSDTLYYASSAFDHHYKKVTYSRPEPYYFWMYFVLMNAVWIVVPACKL